MSDDDTLLAALATHARERPPDACLDALLDGTLSAAERADLLAEGEHDPALAAGIGIFTPLDEAAMDRMSEHLLANVIGAESDDAEAPAEEPAEAAPTEAKVLAFTPKRRWWIAAPVLAAAAAIAFFVMRPSVSILPPYTAEVVGGDLEHRGEDKTPLKARVLRADSRLQVSLQPPTTHAHAIEVHAFVHDGETFHPWAPPVQTANRAARVAGTVAALGLDKFGLGPRTLVFQVVPKGAGAASPSLDADRADVRQILVPVVLK